MRQIAELIARFRTVPGQAVLAVIAFFAVGVFLTLWGVLTDNVLQLICGPTVSILSSFLLWRAIPALLKMAPPGVMPSADEAVLRTVRSFAPDALARVRAAIESDQPVQAADRDTAIRFVRRHAGRTRLFGWLLSAFFWAGLVASDFRALEHGSHLSWIPIAITTALSFIAWRSFRLRQQVRAWASKHLGTTPP